ncbi:MAG: deoxyribose-phosphate aldolase [Spirulinaceae cyanobacterium]
MAHPEIDLARYIDHAVLHPAATPQDVQQACQAAIQYDFPAVCLCPSAVAIATEALHNRSPQVCAVIGFPSGATTSTTKCYEAQEAADNGATELDVVINLGWLKAGNTDAIYQEIAQIVETTGQTVKTILETTQLTPSELRLAAEICMDAGAAFLKTSTGWFGGATVADVKRLRELTQGRVGIKAAGGIRTPEQAIELILAGATRLGTSRGVELIALREQSAQA